MRVEQSRLKSMLQVCVVLLVSAWIVGCTGSHGRVPVVDRNHVRPSQPVTNGSYVVQPGDTLYSIAFRFGWDWKELAKRNNIPAPYTIHPKQRIQFSRTTVAAAPQKKTVTKPAAKQPVAAKKTPAKTTTKKPAPVVAPKMTGWKWPAEGRIVAKFSSSTSLNKGIDIAGKAGQPVFAAHKGTVVYAGSGLRGYGELVIIKHDDLYISAYGHNRTLLVKEGQTVSAGQQIAEMGSTGTDQNKLHFEIRRQGKPVDPLQYLPKR